MRNTTLTVFVLASIFALSSISWSEEITYRKHIKPVFDSKCMGCHGSESPELPEFAKDKKRYKEMSKGPRMDSYTYLTSLIGWPDTGAIMRRLDDGKGTGKQGNMYQHLGSTEDERQQNLKLFKDWVGNWTLKKWKDITKEEMDGVKVKY